MINFDRVANRIFRILKGHGYDVKLFNSAGMDIINPEQARRFYVNEPSLMLTIDEKLREVIFNRSSETALCDYESALQQIKNTANQYMLNFTIREFGKKIEPKDFSHQAKIDQEETMNENAPAPITEASLSRMFGSQRTSRQTLEDVQIVVKHRRAIDEESRGSRSRNISAIFIESNGERTLFPHNNLRGARAMARHITMGGAQDDQIAEHIVESTGNLVKLKEFMRYVRTNKLISENTQDAVSVVRENMKSIVTELNKLTGVKSYGITRSRIEEQKEALHEEETDNTDQYKDMFTVKRFDEKFTDVLPIVSRMVSENERFLKRIEESACSEIILDSTNPSLDCSVIQYETKAAEIGNKLKEMCARICENPELAKFMSGISTKIISEAELTVFEQSVLGNVLGNIQLRNLSETPETEVLIKESISNFSEKLEIYTTGLFIK